MTERTDPGEMLRAANPVDSYSMNASDLDEMVRHITASPVALRPVAARVNPISSERLRDALTTLSTALAALVLPLAAGFGFARLFPPTLHSKYFPWIPGRA